MVPSGYVRALDQCFTALPSLTLRVDYLQAGFLGGMLASPSRSKPSTAESIDELSKRIAVLESASGGAASAGSGAGALQSDEEVS